MRAFYRDFRQAAAKGADAYASYFAEDAVLLPPNAAPLTGRAAIREWQERVAKEPIDGPGATEDELQMSGAFVVYRSTFKGQRAKAAGSSEPVETKCFDLLRRKSDGGYELVRRMWSSNLR